MAHPVEQWLASGRSLSEYPRAARAWDPHDTDTCLRCCGEEYEEATPEEMAAADRAIALWRLRVAWRIEIRNGRPWRRVFAFRRKHPRWPSARTPRTRRFVVRRVRTLRGPPGDDSDPSSPERLEPREELLLAVGLGISTSSTSTCRHPAHVALSSPSTKGSR